MTVGFAYRQIAPDANSEAFLVLAGPAFAACSALGLPFWHWLYFQLQIKVLLCAIVVGESLSVLLLVFGNTDLRLFMAGMVLSGIFLSSHRALLPLITEFLYGKTVGEALDSYLAFAISLLQLISLCSLWYISCAQALVGGTALAAARLVLVCAINMNPRWTRGVEKSKLQRASSRQAGSPAAGRRGRAYVVYI